RLAGCAVPAPSTQRERPSRPVSEQLPIRVSWLPPSSASHVEHSDCKPKPSRLQLRFAALILPSLDDGRRSPTCRQSHLGRSCYHRREEGRMPFTLANPIGRLVEVRIYGILTLDEAQQIRIGMYLLLSTLPGKAIIFTNMMQAEQFSSEVSDRML